MPSFSDRHRFERSKLSIQKHLAFMIDAACQVFAFVQSLWHGICLLGQVTVQYWENRVLSHLPFQGLGLQGTVRLVITGVMCF